MALQRAPILSIRALTDRELQIALQVANGLSSKEIATILAISPKTVDIHRKSINKKLGVQSPVMVARILIRAGVISA